MAEHPAMPEQVPIMQQGAGRCCTSGCADGTVDFLATARFMLNIACGQCRIPCDGAIAVAGNESVVPTTITRRTATTRLGRSPNASRVRAIYEGICSKSTMALPSCWLLQRSGRWNGRNAIVFAFAPMMLQLIRICDGY